MTQSGPMGLSAKRPTVLVVDDSPIGISVLAGVLQSDCRIRVAASGPAALDIVFGPDPPDLILVDVGMPEMDGFEVCRRIKGNPIAAAIPLIFVTGRDSPQDEEFGLGLGAIDYIHKPLNPPLLRTRVRNHLRLKMLSDQLHRLASSDDLTGLANRRSFEQDFDREWGRSRRLREPISLAVVDLDHFKALNDTFGFPMGDGVLRWIARILVSQLHRTTDGAYRWGGEEFAILLPDTPAQGALHVVSAVRDQLADEPLPPDVPERRPTFSAGVAMVIPEGVMTGGELVRRAEMALFAAKEQGRNRTVLYESRP